MAEPIPLFGQKQEESQFKPRIEINVGPELTVIQMQTGPFDIRLQPIPNDLMVQIIPLWMHHHPQEALQIVHDVRASVKESQDMLRSIKDTKL